MQGIIIYNYLWNKTKPEANLNLVLAGVSWFLERFGSGWARPENRGGSGVGEVGGGEMTL